MAVHTESEILVDAPVAFVWAVTNDVRSWPALFTEYASVDVLEETSETVRFRLTMHPDDQDRVWSWVSERRMDPSTWSVQAHRVETGPFEYMNIRWTYEAVENDRTLMCWKQDFTMKPDAPVDDPVMEEHLKRNAVIQMAAVKKGVEERRRRVVALTDVPSNARRGGDLRTLLSPATVGSTSGFCGAVRLAPGERVTEHYHPYSEEFIYVAEGEVRVDIEGVSQVARANTAVFVPLRARHRLVNEGDASVLVTFFLSPLAPRPELGHVDTEELDEPVPAAASAVSGAVSSPDSVVV